MSRENIAWANNLFGANLTENNLEPINDFLFLWSLFERLAFDSHAVNDRLNLFAERYVTSFDKGIINSTFGYFRNRYINDGEVVDGFSEVKVVERLTDFVTSSMIKENTSDLDKLKVCLFIIYRYRNNLFHGIKDILNIHTQSNNFQITNTFLRHIIDQFWIIIR